MIKLSTFEHVCKEFKERGSIILRQDFTQNVSWRATAIKVHKANLINCNSKSSKNLLFLKEFCFRCQKVRFTKLYTQTDLWNSPCQG